MSDMNTDEEEANMMMQLRPQCQLHRSCDLHAGHYGNCSVTLFAKWSDDRKAIDLGRNDQRIVEAVR